MKYLKRIMLMLVFATIIAIMGCGSTTTENTEEMAQIEESQEVPVQEQQEEVQPQEQEVQPQESEEAAKQENTAETTAEEVPVASSSQVGSGDVVTVPDVSGGILTDDSIRYLSVNVGSNETKLNFVWYSKNKDDAYVIMQEQSDMANNEFYSSNKVQAKVKSAKSEDGYYVCKATVKGLKPNTNYKYVVGNDKAWSPVYEYKTANFGNDWSFAVVGDPEMGLATDDESIDQMGIFDTTINNINANIPEAAFLLSTGDQVALCDSNENYNMLLNHEGLYSLAFAPTIGNHDLHDTFFKEHFNIPNFNKIGCIAEDLDNDNYWYTYNDTLFMMINSNNMTDYDDFHRLYVEEVIEKNPDAKWVVAVFHHSPFSSYEKYQNDAKAVQELIPMLEAAGVDVVFNGHDHIYTRSYVMNGTTANTAVSGNTASVNDGIPYITFSSSSSSLYHGAMNNSNAAIVYAEEVPQATRVDVTDSNMKISTYNSQTWELIDEFTLTK